MAALVDVRNANAARIPFGICQRGIAAFSEPRNPNDTGRTEIQASFLWAKIRDLRNHLGAFKQPVANRKCLRRLVHQRVKLLRYLKRTRYEHVSRRLGLKHGTVEGEQVV